MTSARSTGPQNKDISNIHCADSGNIQHPEEGGFNPVKAEMALWAAVITQALMDAGSESNKPEAQHEKNRAIRWLLGNSDDFITVCLNAGLEPSYVRGKALAAIRRGCVWRQGMAEKRQLIPATREVKHHMPAYRETKHLETHRRQHDGFTFGRFAPAMPGSSYYSQLASSTR